MNEEQGLKNVIAYIEAHLKEPLSAEEIAAACYYSRSNTKALFHKVFQYGMMEYVARRKLTQAAEELLFTSRRVCDIAMEYGFESQEVFTRAFKKMWQEPPAVFRKNRMFWQLFPRQDFFCDDCGVFRRRFDLEDMRKMLECREHTWVVCFDMEAPGIRCLKTAFGREGGERFVLDCLQRIEREMKTGDRLFRIAGDKFALLAVSEDCETVLGQAERILKRNGERVRYEGNDVALAMFGGIVELGKKDAWSASLFERLDEVLDGRWEMTKRRLTPEEAPDGQRTGRCRFIYPDYGFPTGTVYHAYEIREGALPAGRLLGYGIDLRKEREYLSFPLRCVQSEKTGLHQPQELSVRQEKLIIRWNQERLGGRMVFPKGENWCVFQVADRDGSVAREHFMVIRDLNVQRTAEGIRLSFEKLFLEAVRMKDGSWIRLNEGELKETVRDLGLGTGEYRKICRIERGIRNRFRQAGLFQTEFL